MSDRDRSAVPAETLERHALRARLLAKADRLPTRDLRRLLEVLDAISDRDARAIAAFAEGLAEWPDPDSRSA